MTIRFTSRLIAELPPLAWLCTLTADGAAELRHGRHVEVFQDGFFEGAWEGSFADRGFAAAANVFGSGARLGPEAITFVGPSTTLEGLYLYREPGFAAVSNSLTFLMARCDLEYDPCNWRYGEQFFAVLNGLDSTPCEIGIKNGSIKLIYHHNFILDPDGSCQLAPKPNAPPFGTFDDYRGYLLAVARQVFANAADPARKRQYRPLATLSSGYDTTACATIARQAGCTEAVSIATSRRGDDDSGEATARALGLDLRQFERPARCTGDDFPEAELMCTGMQAKDFVFTALQERLPGRVLITGHQSAWQQKRPAAIYQQRRDASGTSLGEFRLARDYIYFPLASPGNQRRVEIVGITRSDEMRPYVLDSPYNAPIARRIAEEAGVPREAFGQRKSAPAMQLHRNPALLSERTRADLADFARRQRRSAACRLGYWRALLRFKASMAAMRAYRLGQRAQAVRFELKRGKNGRLRLRRRPANVDYSNWYSRKVGAWFRRVSGHDFAVMEHAHPRATIWLRWGYMRMKDRYAPAGVRTGRPAGAAAQERDLRPAAGTGRGEALDPA